MSSSSPRICKPRAGCATCSRSAARLMLPSSHTAMKVSNWRSLIPLSWRDAFVASAMWSLHHPCAPVHGGLLFGLDAGAFRELQEAGSVSLDDPREVLRRALQRLDAGLRHTGLNGRVRPHLLTLGGELGDDCRR